MFLAASLKKFGKLIFSSTFVFFVTHVSERLLSRSLENVSKTHLNRFLLSLFVRSSTIPSSLSENIFQPSCFASRLFVLDQIGTISAIGFRAASESLPEMTKQLEDFALRNTERYVDLVKQRIEFEVRSSLLEAFWFQAST